MKKKFYFFQVILTLLFFTFSCKDDKSELLESHDVSENIIGSWLLATSDAENWVSYEFTQSTRIYAELTNAGVYHTGDGWYSIDESKRSVSGSYTTERGETFYLEWIVEKVQPFQIDFKLYDDNTYLGESSLYRVLSKVEVEMNGVSNPDYRGLSGNNNASGFTSLDPRIATVNASTGEIKGVSVGTTFVTFLTSNGKAAIKVEVIPKAKSFAEMLVGTWVYDKVAEKDWERFTYEENGLVRVEWITKDGIYDFNESRQSTYTINGETVSFVIKVDAGQMNMNFETESINDFIWTYKSVEGNIVKGKYTVQKVLYSLTMEPREVRNPNYQVLTSGYEITGYESHDPSIATVNGKTGEITAITPGRTYIDVKTPKGDGVIEINVESGAIPYPFQDCIGKKASNVKDMLGSPFYEDETTLVYQNLTNTIDMVGIALDSFTGLVKGITITYNNKVDTSEVTSILNVLFIPYQAQTTATFKAYMDTSDRADASIGVTWDIPSKILTYVNLATDLFPDYSILIGMTRDQVVNKMGREPYSSNDKSQSFFFFDNKGIAIVSAFYISSEIIYDRVKSVVTMFDDTLTSEEITSFLKRKYPYYPEYSSEEDLVFIPKDQSMIIFYTPKDKMLMYITPSETTKSALSGQDIKKLKALSKLNRRQF